MTILSNYCVCFIQVSLFLLSKTVSDYFSLVLLYLSCSYWPTALHDGQCRHWDLQLDFSPVCSLSDYAENIPKYPSFRLWVLTNQSEIYAVFHFFDVKSSVLSQSSQ